MSQFLVHNGYLGWSYGTPADPQLISPSDAIRIMEAVGLDMSQVEQIIPAAQYASEGDHLFIVTGGNRFLYCGDVRDCAGVNPNKVNAPLAIDWQVA